MEDGVWRSLPLFTGLLLAAAALIGQTISRLPPLQIGFYSIATHVLLTISVVCFCISFWWLWQIARPREFEYPPDEVLFSTYATDMASFHAGQGLEGDELDEAVVHDLRIYSSKQLAEVASSHFRNNQARLSARSQVLVFVLAGFIVAIFCEGSISAHDELSGDAAAGTRDDGSSQGTADRPEDGLSSNSQGEAAEPPADADREGRRLVDETQSGTASPAEVVGRRE